MTELICIRLFDTGFQIRNNPKTLNTFVFTVFKVKIRDNYFFFRNKRALFYFGVFSFANILVNVVLQELGNEHANCSCQLYCSKPS